MQRIAENGIRFDRAFSASNFTLGSLTAILTGRFASTTGVIRWGTSLGEGVPLLPEILGFYGYRTAAVTADAGSGFRPEYGISRGFQRFVVSDPPRDTPDGRHQPGEIGPGGATARPLADWIVEQEAERPMFALLHTRTAHYPFLISDEGIDQDSTGMLKALWQESVENTASRPGTSMAQELELLAEDADPIQDVFRRAGPEGLTIWKQAYFDAVERMDLDVGVVWDALETRGRLDKTVFVLLADHGESLNDNGELLHGGAFFDGVIRIPMLISIPGIEAGDTNAMVSQVDLLPTLLEIVGVVPPSGIDGTSMLPLLQGETEEIRGTALSEGGPGKEPGETLPGAVIAPPWVLLRQPNPCSDMMVPPPQGGSPGHASAGSGPHDNGPPGPPPGNGPPGPPLGDGPPGPPPGEGEVVHGTPGEIMNTCLFNLDDDPKQEDNRAEQEEATVESLLARWDGFRMARAGDVVAEPIRLDPAFVELLQRTGYNFNEGVP